jgi:hypothetical protein
MNANLFPVSAFSSQGRGFPGINVPVISNRIVNVREKFINILLSKQNQFSCEAVSRRPFALGIACAGCPDTHHRPCSSPAFNPSLSGGIVIFTLKNGPQVFMLLIS